MTAVPQPDTTAPRPVGRFEWEAVLRRLALPKEVKYVGFVMATYADPNGTRIRPGAAELAAAVGDGESTLRRRVSFLRKAGLIVQTSRGGGRNGAGRATEYRLTLPPDLLEQFEIRPVSAPRIAAVPSVPEQVSPLAQGERSEGAEDPDSPLTQGERSNDSSPVDNSDSPLALVSAQTETPPDFDRSNNGVSETLTARFSALTAHPWVSNYRPQDLPPRPTTAETPDVTTDRASDEHANPIDLVPAAVELGPRRCPHGLSRAIRDDGTPRCPACRRGLPAGKDPT
jgi:hypothetical protein